ncbi:prostate stem cell antigen-like [Rhinatrema bivittatum]|uniref:prostate stem cell antigen-like n=1 Tax=Rhinatrema bivittatum TaxID=194408 RepID=UPI001126AFB5|nr:prostate stem cell antigen-like [Rhinatrema bivittatum]
MRAFLLPLLAVALCLHTAHSLKCYTCEKQHNNGQCLVETPCLPSQRACWTLVSTTTKVFTTETTIWKRCSSLCATGVTSYNGVRTVASCCYEDLCNVSGATSARISSLALAVSAGFIVSLLRAGL